MKFKAVYDYIEQKTNYSHTYGIETQNLPYIVQFSGHVVMGKKFYLQRSNQNFMLFFYTVGGQGKIIVNNEEFIAKKGSVFIINGKSNQVYYTFEDEKWEFKFLHFLSYKENSILKMLSVHQNETINTDTTINEIFNIIKDFDIFTDIKLSMLMNNLLTDLLLYNKTPRSDIPIYSAVESAIQYIQDNYHKKISIGEICDKLHFSKYYFIHIFKQHVGISPYEYLIKYRVNSSKQLLLKKISISETAILCGFGSSNNYNKIFKKLTGMTPNSFRQQNKTL